MEASGVETYGNLVDELARRDGYAVERRDKATTIVEFDMGRGRHQTVWVRYQGEDADGNYLVTMSSAVLKLRTGEKLDVERANYLLRENAKLAHGAWAIDEGVDENDEYDYLVMTETRFAQTLEPQELIESVIAVAELADAMENVLTGRDIF